MKILEKEIALREETRGVEQAKAQLKVEDFEEKALDLADTQTEISERTETVIEMIRDLPDGEANFGKEIQQLTNAANAMWDADDILRSPNTGAPAIGAESEAIEWLLMAKRSSGGGGGGGSNPGNGNRTGQDLNQSALALLGESREKLAKKEEREVSQSTGNTTTKVPANLRDGLDDYFEALERQGGR